MHLNTTTKKLCTSSLYPKILIRHRAGHQEDITPLRYYGGLNGPLRDNSYLRQAVPANVPHRYKLRDANSDDSISIVAAGTSANVGSSTFNRDFNTIQSAAAHLVAIQEMAKRKGAFSEEDNKVYAHSLFELGQAAQNLAKLQQTGQLKDFSILLQPEAFPMPQKQPFGAAAIAATASITASADSKVDDQKVDEVNEQQLGADDLLPPNNEDPYEDVNDSVAIMAPKKDASVAEAKPVGLSIAGEGGVASSKPNAVALSGRNGLAVASPKATAIAGVSPEEAAAFSISLPSRNQLVLKTTNTAADKSNKDDDDYDYYSELPAAHPHLPLTRVATNGIKLPVRSVASIASKDKGDAFVAKWRTAIAEDYAAAPGEAGLQRTASGYRPKLHYL